MAAGDSSSQASGASPGPQGGASLPAGSLAALSCYALLEVAENATPEELRQAFRRQSKRLHPDTTSLPAAQAQDAFRQLRQAYGTLLDPQRRRAYDASLAAARAAARGIPGQPTQRPADQAARAGAPTWSATPQAPPPLRTAEADGSAQAADRGGGAPSQAPAQGANPAARPAGAGPGSIPSSASNRQGGKGRVGSGLGTDGWGPGLAHSDNLPKPDSVRRTLSGGEWFALLLLGLALVFCLVLGVGLAWLRGTELVREPSWWAAGEPVALPQPVGPAAQRPEPRPPGPIPPATPPATTPAATPAPLPETAPGADRVRAAAAGALEPEQGATRPSQAKVQPFSDTAARPMASMAAGQSPPVARPAEAGSAQAHWEPASSAQINSTQPSSPQPSSARPSSARPSSAQISSAQLTSPQPSSTQSSSTQTSSGQPVPAPPRPPEPLAPWVSQAGTP